MKKTFGQKTLTFFKRLTGIFSIVFAVCLVMSMLAAFISPQKFFLFAFFGLFFPVFFLLNLNSPAIIAAEEFKLMLT